MKLAEFQKIAEMLAREHKIRVIEGNGWAANLKTRDVMYRKEDVYNLSEDHILGLTLHEIAHIHYTSEVAMPKDNPELAGTTLNMIEDIAIEYIISGDYPNAGEILATTKVEVLDTLVKMLPKMKRVSMFEKSLLYAAVKFEGRGYQYGIEKHEIIGDKICKIMQKDETIIYDRKHTKDLMPLVEEIMKLLIQELGQPTDEEKQSMKDQNGQGNANQNSQETAKRQVINALKKNQGWEDTNIDRDVQFIDEIGDQALRIGKQLRTVLKRNNAMEYGGRYRTGKLQAKRFVRVLANKDRRPFSRRIIKSNQSYAFAIAADVSGSMFSGRQKNSNGNYALSSMQMVGEALRTAGVPRALIIFGMQAKVVAPMNKLQARWEQIINRQDMNKANNNGTNIAKSIQVCHKELNKVKAERKIMIILTDGGSNREAMKEAHKEATKAGIECLGITIGGGTWDMDETFGKEKNIKIGDKNETSEIGKAFINILKKSIAMSPK